MHLPWGKTPLSAMGGRAGTALLHRGIDIFPPSDPRIASHQLLASVSPNSLLGEGVSGANQMSAVPGGSRSAPAWRRISPGWQNWFP